MHQRQPQHNPFVLLHDRRNSPVGRQHPSLAISNGLAGPSDDYSYNDGPHMATLTSIAVDADVIHPGVQQLTGSKESVRWYDKNMPQKRLDTTHTSFLRSQWWRRSDPPRPPPEEGDEWGGDNLRWFFVLCKYFYSKRIAYHVRCQNNCYRSVYLLKPHYHVIMGQW